MKIIYTTGEVARLIGCAPRTVSMWIDNGHMKGFRLPGSEDRRVHRSDLLVFLQSIGYPTETVERECFHNLLLIGSTNSFYETLVNRFAERQTKVYLVDSLFSLGMEYEKKRPSIIIVDFVLGVSDSLALGKSFSYSKEKGFIPRHRSLFAILNEDSDIDPKKIKEYGFEKWVKRPFNTEDLVNEVETFTKTLINLSPTGRANIGDTTVKPKKSKKESENGTPG